MKCFKCLLIHFLSLSFSFSLSLPGPVGVATQDERIHELGREAESVRSHLGQQRPRFYGGKRDARGERRRPPGERSRGGQRSTRTESEGYLREEMENDYDYDYNDNDDGGEEEMVDGGYVYPYEQYAHRSERRQPRRVREDFPEEEFEDTEFEGRSHKYPRRGDEYERRRDDARRSRRSGSGSRSRSRSRSRRRGEYPGDREEEAYRREREAYPPRDDEYREEKYATHQVLGYRNMKD